MFDEGTQGGLAFALLGLQVEALPRLGVLDLVSRLQVWDQVSGDAAFFVLVGVVLPEERFTCHVSSTARIVVAILPARAARPACFANHDASS